MADEIARDGVPRKLPDWEAPARSVLTATEALYLVLLAVLIGGFLFVLGETLGTAGMGITLILFFIAGLIISLATSSRRALLSASARQVGPEELPRVTNILTGLARDLAVTQPRLRVCDDPEPNAMVGRAGGPVITVTTGLAELSRTEIEAVLAHCFARLHGKGLWVASLAAELVFLAGPLRPMVGDTDDVQRGCHHEVPAWAHLCP